MLSHLCVASFSQFYTSAYFVIGLILAFKPNVTKSGCPIKFPKKCPDGTTLVVLDSVFR